MHCFKLTVSNSVMTSNPTRFHTVELQNKALRLILPFTVAILHINGLANIGQGTNVRQKIMT